MLVASLLIIAFASPNIQNPAERLLRQVEAKTRSLKGFSCDFTAQRTFTSTKPGVKPIEVAQRMHFEFKRPNLFSIVSEGYRSVSDGENLYWASKDGYTETPVSKSFDYHWFNDDLLNILATGSFTAGVRAPRAPALKMLPDETWAGSRYRVIEANVEGGYPIRYRLYVGDDLLVHRIIHEEAYDGRQTHIDSSALTISSDTGPFSFTHGSELKRLTASLPLAPGEFPQIQVGSVAPDFSLATPSGGWISLHEAMKGKRAVLLNFWFVHCPPCRAEHPHLQRFYDEFARKGLGLIAIDDQDSADQSAKYLRGAGLIFPVALTGPRFRTDTNGQPTNSEELPDHASLAPYGIHEFPTNVLVDAKTGKVVYVANGWDEKALREAFDQIGR